MNPSNIVRTVHRWLGLFLGAQFVLWMMSGVVMSWFDIDLVRGENAAYIDFPVELEARSYASPGGVIAQMEGVTEVSLKTFLGKPAYEVKGANGVALFSARTGVKISPLSEEQIRIIAMTDFIGDAEIDTLEKLSTAPKDYRGQAPVWRAQLNDRLHTRLYISPDTGEVLARRNDVWRIYDFFWMLHIMDYSERTNFNNPLIRTMSATGVIFALSGVFLIFKSLMMGRYRLPRRRGSSDT